MREYKIAKGWAIFIYITAPILMGLFCWLLINTMVTNSARDLKIVWILILGSIGMIGIIIVGLIDTVKAKFVIDTDRVISVSTLATRQLLFTEIKGFSVMDGYIFIEPDNQYSKQIKISKYFRGTDEIENWLANNFANLDVVTVIEEKEEILNNDAFGWTPEQRAERLKKASTTAKVLNWTGGIIGAWTMFVAKPYQYAIIASIVFPIICLVVYKYFNGLIRIDEKKITAYPSIFVAIFISSLGLCLRALFDYNIFDYSKLWVPSITITLFYMAIVIKGKKFDFNKPNDYAAIIGFSLFTFGYGVGVVITLNCMYDTSKPTTYHATVLNKRISSGENKSYYIALTPWGQQQQSDEVSISKALYNGLALNDKVNIYFRDGQLGIPWFKIMK